MGNKKAFTLMEMLIVVALIGVLASFAFAVLIGARENAQEKGILANMRSMQTHSNLYLALNDTYGVPQNSADCDSGLFADSEFNRVKDAIIVSSAGLSRCAIGAGGQTFAYRIISEDFGTLCVDNFSITRNDIVWAADSAASCQ